MDPLISHVPDEALLGARATSSNTDVLLLSLS